MRGRASGRGGSRGSGALDVAGGTGAAGIDGEPDGGVGCSAAHSSRGTSGAEPSGMTACDGAGPGPAADDCGVSGVLAAVQDVASGRAVADSEVGRPEGAEVGAADGCGATSGVAAVEVGVGRGVGAGAGGVMGADAEDGGSDAACRGVGAGTGPTGGVAAGAGAGSACRGDRPAAKSATRSATRYTRSTPPSVGLRVTAVDARTPGPRRHATSLGCVARISCRRPRARRERSARRRC
jgi:hypothetical protein